MEEKVQARLREEPLNRRFRRRGDFKICTGLDLKDFLGFYVPPNPYIILILGHKIVIGARAYPSTVSSQKFEHHYPPTPKLVTNGSPSPNRP